jgi:hypothetical protein
VTKDEKVTSDKKSHNIPGVTIYQKRHAFATKIFFVIIIMVKLVLPPAWIDKYTARWKGRKITRNHAVHIPRRKRKANRRRDRSFGIKHLNELNEREFRMMYRMTRKSFMKLFSMVKSDLTKCSKQAECSSGSAIPSISKLAATIRWLAGGSYLDIAALFGLDPGNFFHKDNGPLWQTIRILDTCFNIGLDLSESNLEKTGLEFSRFSNGTMNNCVMAIDGLVVKTKKPSRKDVGNVKAYRNRKSCWGMVILAGCDANCKFTMLCARNSGSSHDYICWEGCALKRLIEAGKLPPRFYII